MRQYLRAKLHGIRVTGAELNYHGSITLDPEICDRAGIEPLEFVDIWNRASGARLSTYVIFGEPGSRCCVLNGAAARTCQVGDPVIIAASEYATSDRLTQLRPVVLTFDADNQIDQVLRYEIYASAERRHDFRLVEDGAAERQPPASAPRGRSAGARSVRSAPDLAALRADLAGRGWTKADIDAFVRRHL